METCIDACNVTVWVMDDEAGIEVAALAGSSLI